MNLNIYIYIYNPFQRSNPSLFVLKRCNPPQAASQCGITTLPPTIPPNLTSDTSFLQALHHVLVNVNVVSGVLKCPDTGREFSIRDGICDFMLEEEECENVKI